MADFITLVAVYMVFFLLTSYVILCGDSEFHRQGIVGKLRRAVVQILAFIFYICFPQRLQNLLSDIITYLCYKRNRYIQALYIIIFSGVLWVFASQVHPRAEQFGLPAVHTVAPYLGMAVNLAIYAACCWSDPGVITAENHSRCACLFKYDGILYHKGVKCRTCQLVKPARSKHCAYCDHCVYRFDHHCSWVNNCIGGRNARYFLLLLFSIALIAAYISYVTGCMLRAVAAKSGIWQAGYIGKDGEFHRVDSRIVFQHLFMQLPAAVFLLTSLLLLGILIVIFLSYHLFLLVTNQTTNERYKRSRVVGQVIETKKSRSSKGKSSGERGKVRVDSFGHDHAPTARTWHYNRGFVRNILEVICPPL